LHDPIPASDVVHTLHVWHAADPAAANDPAMHVLHVSDVGAPDTFDAVPDTHCVHAVALTADHTPDPHLVHTKMLKSVVVVKSL
jgi:hypothetical protein